MLNFEATAMMDCLLWPGWERGARVLWVRARGSKEQANAHLSSIHTRSKTGGLEI